MVAREELMIQTINMHAQCPSCLLVSLVFGNMYAPEIVGSNASILVLYRWIDLIDTHAHAKIVKTVEGGDRGEEDEEIGK